mmetsp:Transcript_143032/g.398537  ORF Transcript_143032/g.398537 Transcript_143032/m.398537 type:complete len:533 (-) Transcript_143032:169-1767(-)
MWRAGPWAARGPLAGEEADEALAMLSEDSTVAAAPAPKHSAMARAAPAVLLIAAAGLAVALLASHGGRGPAAGAAAAWGPAKANIIGFASGDFDCSIERRAWTEPQKDWCCSQGGIQCQEFATVAWATSDSKPIGVITQGQVSMMKDDVVTVFQKHDSGWSYVRNRGRDGWVPTSSLAHGKPAAGIKDLQGTSEGSGHQPQLPVTAGDVVWLKNTTTSGKWSFVFVRGKEGWVPSEALRFTVDGVAVTATAAFVTKDFHANQNSSHPQVSVRRGEPVWVAGGQHAWSFVASPRGQGWAPGSSLSPMQAAVVLRAPAGAAASADLRPVLQPGVGDAVWATGRNESGWFLVQSKGRLGWIPVEALQPPEAALEGLPALAAARTPKIGLPRVVAVGVEDAKSEHTIVAEVPTPVTTPEPHEATKVMEGAPVAHGAPSAGGSGMGIVEVACLVGAGIVVCVATALLAIACIWERIAVQAVETKRNQQAAHTAVSLKSHQQLRSELTENQVSWNCGRRSFTIDELRPPRGRANGLCV